AALSLGLLSGSSIVPTPSFAQTPDCAGPAGDPEPATPEWDQRDQDNQYCTQERHADYAQHPVLAPVGPFDQYRVPERHNGARFRYALVQITNRDGVAMEAEIYAPCKAGSCPDLASELQTFEPPYPGAVLLHGGGGQREITWWSSQPLAEAGYLVVAPTVSSHQPDAEDVLDWFFATPTNPTERGQFNPFWQEFDREPIGIAGHSAGGVAVNVIGHADPRVGAVASWLAGALLITLLAPRKPGTHPTEVCRQPRSGHRA
ncbi:MAG: alpha/beta hydrolase family protein, partial [Gemmatimonadales bacterium]